jgi:hypothetical protein
VKSLLLAGLLLSVACAKRPSGTIVSVTKTVGHDSMGNETPGLAWCTVKYGDGGTEEWTATELDAPCDARHLPNKAKRSTK